MSMLSIVTTGNSAFRKTCFRRTRHSLRTLRPSRAHVVLVHRLEHARPDHARVERGKQQREREPRQNHVVRPVHRPAAGRAVGSNEVAVPGDRKDVQPEAERVREDSPSQTGCAEIPIRTNTIALGLGATAAGSPRAPRSGTRSAARRSRRRGRARASPAAPPDDDRRDRLAVRTEVPKSPCRGAREVPYCLAATGRARGRTAPGGSASSRPAGRACRCRPAE